mgnify:CR=1 FL=1
MGKERRIKMSRKLKTKKHMLLKKAEKYVQPLKHTEFSCPICGGVATVTATSFGTRAECHACGAWEEKR